MTLDGTQAQVFGLSLSMGKNIYKWWIFQLAMFD